MLLEHIAQANLVPLVCVRTTTTVSAEVARAIIAITAISTQRGSSDIGHQLIAGLR